MLPGTKRGRNSPSNRKNLVGPLRKEVCSADCSWGNTVNLQKPATGQDQPSPDFFETHVTRAEKFHPKHAADSHETQGPGLLQVF